MKIAVMEKSAVTEGDIDFKPLDELCEVVYFDNVEYSGLKDAIGDAEGVIVNKSIVDAALMDTCPNLRYVGTFATGYNNVDVRAAKERGIVVCNVPDYSSDAVAQHAAGFILMTASGLFDYITSVRRGDWMKSRSFCYYPYYMTELKGKTLGVLGLGNIGKKVAALGKALGMNVIVHTRTRRADCVYETVDLNRLFKESDWLTLHVPLTPDTREIVCEKTLSLMKKSAVLINTARGGLVNERDLARALKEGVIRAACLDVLSAEPMKSDCPLFGLDNCYITPHVAWAPRETRQRLIDIAAENLRAFIAGKPVNDVTEG